MNLKNMKLIAKICAVVFTFIFGVVMVGGALARERKSEISGALGQQTFEMIPGDEEYDEADTIYFDSDFTSVAELKEAGGEIAEELSLEGSALLKNDDNALPLEKGNKINLYSMSSYDPIYNGTGDQGRAYENLGYTHTHMLDAFTEAGFDVNEELFHWYKDNYNQYGRKHDGKSLRAWGNAIYKQYTIADAGWSDIETDAKNAAADAGIFILSRIAGEGSDVTTHDIGLYPGDMTHGNHLKLSPTEIDVLTNMKRLKDEGTLDKIIVVLNFSNQVECKFIDEAKFGVDAAIWVGNFGQRGPEALAKLLLGEVNPSGKLVDTFWKEHYYNPVLANFGDVGGGTYKFADAKYGSDDNSYVVYQEGIYVGYRYTETRYEDVVTGRARTGDFVYTDAVSYPFGYGISYTTFAYSDFVVKENDMTNPKTYELSVKVTNTGRVDGKEAVQFYLQKPYTQYDKDNGIEKAAVEIVGYGKTDTLKPGATQSVGCIVDQSYFASYDAYGAGTYIMDEGAYYFTAAPDAHTAVNNILLKKAGENVRDNAGWVEMPSRTSDGALAEVTKINALDTKTYAKSKWIKEKEVPIVNRFDDVDILTYDKAGDENKRNMTYITRDDWSGTVKHAWSDYENGVWADNEVKLKMNAAMAADSKKPELKKDNVPYPTMGADNGLSLIDLQSDLIKYDDPLWAKLLDQMKWEEMCELIGNGHGGTRAVESINKFATYDMDSAVGVDQYFDSGGRAMTSFAMHYNDPDKHSKSTSYPGNDTVAATYNAELVKRTGVQWGEDCLWVGYTCLYGPGVNLHRSPYGGRNYNYFSEDGFMTGRTAALMVAGMKTKGAENLIKHVGLNEQETNRIGGTTWANEQSIREIYLKGAEIAIGESKCQGVMASLARMGMKYCGHQGFYKYVIREEFGATGYNVSDSFMGYMSPSYCVLMGQGLPLSSAPGDLLNKESGYGEFAWALREECHRVLYTVVHSNGMNFQAPGMKVKIITPPWLAALNTLQAVVSVLFALSLGFLVAVLVMGYLPERYKFRRRKKTNKQGGNRYET